MCLCLCLSVYVFLSVYVPIHPSIPPCLFHSCLSVCLSVCLPVCLSIHLSLFVCLPIYLSICPPRPCILACIRTYIHKYTYIHMQSLSRAPKRSVQHTGRSWQDGSKEKLQLLEHSEHKPKHSHAKGPVSRSFFSLQARAPHLSALGRAPGCLSVSSRRPMGLEICSRTCIVRHSAWHARAKRA